VSLFLCQLVVSKDIVTCPSCLHTQSGNSCRYANDGECDEPTHCPYGTDTSDCSGGGAPGSLMNQNSVDCFTRRKDEKVCCGNGRWVESSQPADATGLRIITRTVNTMPSAKMLSADQKKQR